MSKKIRIAKQTYDVLEETDLRNIVFDSDYDTLKYYSSGTVTIYWDSATETSTIAHNLGYKPFFVAFFGEVGAGLGDYCFCPFTFTFFGGHVIASAWADSTNIYVDLDAGAAPGTPRNIYFHYKIFRNKLSI